MKLLIFAHKPPPHHGQSYMVLLLLSLLGGDRRRPSPATETPAESALEAGGNRIECYHVDSRFSDAIESIGRVGWRKVLRLFKYGLEAVACRFRHGDMAFLYIPAPGVRPALYRDWLVMALCRPFFSRRIFYWQAAGLGDWLATQAHPWERGMTRLLLGRPDLSIVLAEFNRRDGEYLRSSRIAVVPNAVADPCPRFETEILPRRVARARARQALLAGQRPPDVHPEAAGDRPHIFRVLFMSLCHRPKGLFDAIEAVTRANRELQASSVRVKLSVAGAFWFPREQQEFEAAARAAGAIDGEPMIEYAGFVSGEDKTRLLRESDCFCFPTYYSAESFGLVLVEAMAFGLPAVVSRWRMMPELLPTDYPGLVDPQAPDQIAAALLAWIGSPYEPSLRRHFLEHYTTEQFARQMQAALRLLDRPPD